MKFTAERFGSDGSGTRRKLIGFLRCVLSAEHSAPRACVKGDWHQSRRRMACSTSSLIRGLVGCDLPAFARVVPIPDS